MNKVRLPLLICILFLSIPLITSCKPKQELLSINRVYRTWYAFSTEKYKGTLYISMQNELLDIVLCGKISGILSSISFQSRCNAESFDKAKNLLSENSFTYLGTAPYPNTDQYPDLTNFAEYLMEKQEFQDLFNAMGLKYDE